MILVHSAEVYNCYCLSVVQCSFVTFAIDISFSVLDMLREIRIGMPYLGRGNGKSLETMDDVILQFKFKFSRNDPK